MAWGNFDLSTSNGYVSGHVNWWSTTNNNENYSTVFVEMRFSRTNSGYTTTGSGGFDVWIDGQNIHNDTGFTITQNSDTLVLSGNRRVYHNNDGTKSIQIAADGNTNVFDVWWNGVTVSLDNIPRASTLASNISWTAGSQNLPISINRSSSDFTHLVEIWVQEPSGNWYYIGSRSNIGSSTTFSFSKDENTSIYNAFHQYEDRPVKLRITTYNGNNWVGANDYYGTVYAIAPGTMSYNNWGQFNIGDNVTGWINNWNSNFTYNITLTFGSFTKSWNNATTDSNLSLTFLPAEIQSLYAQIPNANSGNATVTCRTLYNGVYTEDGIPVSHDTTFTFNVTNSNPTYTGGFTYLDTNATTTGITNNNQYIVQGKSTLQVKIPATAKATAKNNATMSRYDVVVNGITKSVNYSSTDLTVDFGTINVSSNATVTVSAIDSRGNKTSASSTILVLPYSPPVISVSADRLNNFEASTTVTLSGSASSLTISGTNKNAITVAKYQYRQVGGTYNTATNMTVTGFPTFTATNVTLTLDNTIAWDVLVTVTDKVGSTVTLTRSVAVGTPIFFIDSVKKTIGINKFPTSAANGLEIAGNLDVDGIIKVKASQFVSGANGAALQMRNSDISGVNGIFFNDEASGTEGLNFPKTGKSGSVLSADYDSIIMLDSVFSINDKPIFTQIGGNTSNIRLGGEVYSQQTGGMYMDVWGNLLGQPGAGSGNNFSIKDADGRKRFLTYIGKGATGGTELWSWTNGIDFWHDNAKVVTMYQNNNNNDRILQFGDNAGFFKWSVSANRLEAGVGGGWSHFACILDSMSSRDYKKNIEKYDGNAIDIIKTSIPSLYHYKTQDDSERQHVGLIAEEAPQLIRGSDGKTIDTYGMVTLSWKAIQELLDRIDKLEKQTSKG